MAKVSSVKFKTDREHFDKAFYTLELLDKGGERQSGQPGSLNHYTIDYVQFCHRPLTHKGLAILVDLLKAPEFLLLRLPHKLIDKTKEIIGETPEEIIPGLPSPHHRYIRFRTGQCYPNTSEKVWGTMERLEEEVICALYKNERASVRSNAHVTQIGMLPFSDQLEMYTKCIGVDEVYRGIGGRWNGDYHLTDNNCIHYALECWKRLGGNASWNEVVDGHESILLGDHDAAGRNCFLM